MSYVNMILGANSNAEHLSDERVEVARGNRDALDSYKTRVAKARGGAGKSSVNSTVQGAVQNTDLYEAAATIKTKYDDVQRIRGFTKQLTGGVSEAAGSVGKSVAAVGSSEAPVLATAVDDAASAAKQTKGLVGAFSKGIAGAAGIAGLGEDVDSFIKGKGPIAGDNVLEKISNVTAIVGSALSFVPGAEMLGGVLDGVSAVTDLVGEKEASNDSAVAKQKAADAVARPTMQTAPTTASWNTLGAVSNASHPVTQMIHGSGAF
eukprot:SAG22_NODE_509_length_9598_cov_12.010001_9_plen_263_part_00